MRPLESWRGARVGRGSSGSHAAAADDDEDLRNLRRQPVVRDRTGRRCGQRHISDDGRAARQSRRAGRAAVSATPTTTSPRYYWPRRAASHRRSSRVALATDMSATRVVELLDSMAHRRIITADGNRVRFTHPLFATGVYTNATPSRRRAMHRRLATVVERPEIRARHLALAATTGDATTLSALDAAAEATVAQGAPAVAAELLELALKLGGDNAVRRIRAGELHFRAGSLVRRACICRQRSPTRPGRAALSGADVAWWGQGLRRRHGRCGRGDERGRRRGWRRPSAGVAVSTASGVGAGDDRSP